MHRLHCPHLLCKPDILLALSWPFVDSQRLSLSLMYFEFICLVRSLANPAYCVATSVCPRFSGLSKGLTTHLEDPKQQLDLHMVFT